ncbi:hypothetical protein [Derxia gummosa]|uniref:Uncharacterized protein n=1 Tax=Derxia gummosa DSM 723 TaxID=1121388 RepID=A0A8B6X3C3_9BURK|nr:hypothetical protein [Derxia gummosa]
MKIECLVRGEIEFNVHAATLLAAMADVQKFIGRMKGVRSVLHVGTQLFHLDFAPREVLGIDYQPECILRFDLSRPGHVAWTTIDGNLRFDGDVRVRPTASGCAVGFLAREITDLPLVPVLVTGAEAIGRVDLNQRMRELIATLDLRDRPPVAMPQARPARRGMLGFLRAGHA